MRAGLIFDVHGNPDADMVDVPDLWHDPVAVGASEATQRVGEIGLWCAGWLQSATDSSLPSCLRQSASVTFAGCSVFMAHRSRRTTSSLLSLLQAHAACGLVIATRYELGTELLRVCIDSVELSRQVEAGGMRDSAWWFDQRREP
ncbi:hypothetical protein BMS3Abin02_02141 [bacterium BMS3Abin02]|nr:hypothetical protein BMS3Abin02_02141 [bacterium BMS3Abin02]